MKKAKPRSISTPRPSFPKVILDRPIKGLRRKKRWQVICGDLSHYRIGLYSPEIGSKEEIREFEKHSCDEFFILLEGSVSLALMKEVRGQQKVRVIKLKPLQPVLVRSWHNGFCPTGAFGGIALVVERDHFKTWMKSKF